MSKIPQIKEFQGLPVVTSEKMKYIDKKASMEYGISEETLMENAGKALYEEIKRFSKDTLKKDINKCDISVFCGRGNNGGDGLVCSRYLKENGANVKVFMVSPSEKGYNELVVKNLEKTKKCNIDIQLTDFNNIDEIPEKIKNTDLIIDALLGISAIGKPVGVVKRLIQIANKSLKPIIAVDIPSGLSPDTGHHSGVFIKATLTLTLGLAKTGLMAAHAQKNIGTLKVLDIGYPKELIENNK